ncbi:MAG: hypothetical protein P4L73_10060 [Caulobacteraceae bacterium]|nr:hypothetical protein [Caulobacteraceae bacterium]
MAGIEKFVRLARASQRTGFALPVIESADEAVKVVREVAAGLASLPENDRLNLLSDLRELSIALEGRSERLRQEMAGNLLTLKAASFGRKVCSAYARNAAAVARIRPRS